MTSLGVNSLTLLFIMCRFFDTLDPRATDVDLELLMGPSYWLLMGLMGPKGY